MVLYNEVTGAAWFALSPFDWRLAYGINYVLDSFALWVLGVGWVGALTHSARFAFAYYDLLTGAMVLALFSVVMLESGSIVRALQVASIMVLILPAEVYLYDRPAFNMEVSSVQKYSGLPTWFTNADLFVAAVTVFAATTAAGALRLAARRRRLAL